MAFFEAGSIGHLVENGEHENRLLLHEIPYYDESFEEIYPRYLVRFFSEPELCPVVLLLCLYFQ